jgi:predicted PurR-regulated permease PerM
LKKLVIVFVILIVYFHLIPQVNANIQLSPENISAIQINRLSGGMRVFNENDGYEEPVPKKVVEWINSSNAIKEKTKKPLKHK